jgi:hypothetical protein
MNDGTGIRHVRGYMNGLNAGAINSTRGNPRINGTLNTSTSGVTIGPYRVLVLPLRWLQI